MGKIKRTSHLKREDINSQKGDFSLDNAARTQYVFFRNIVALDIALSGEGLSIIALTREVKMLRNGTLAREGRHYLVTCTTYGHAPILFDHADLVSHAIHPRAGRTPYHLMAWAILPDHLHLVIDSRGQRLRDIIDTIKLTFGWFYRIRTGHRGPIWELHFKSRLVSDDWDLKDTIDFVENNAVRHGLVTDSLLYPHSSLHELMQRGGTPTDRTLITTDLAIAN